MAEPCAKRGGLRDAVAAAFTVTAVFILSNAPTPLYVSWQNDWGFSSGMLTVIFACYMVGLVGTLLLAGSIADQHGRRVVLLPALAAAVISGLLFLGAQGVAWLLVARFLAGVAVGGAVTAGMAAVVDLTPEARRKTGGLIASASMVLGAGFGPLLSGGIAQVTDTPQKWVFAVVTVFAVMAVIIGVFLPLTRPARQTSVVQPTGKWHWPSPPREHRRELLWGAATFAPGITATSFVLSLGPSVLAGPIDSPDPFAAGAIACVMFFVATGIQFVVGRVSIRGHLVLSSAAAVVAMLLLIAAVTAAPWWPVFLASAVFSGAAQGLGQLAGLTLIATHIAADRRAESNAVLNVAGYIPAGLLPVMTGFIADGVGMASAVVVFALVLGGFALIALPVVAGSTHRYLEEPVTDETSSAVAEPTSRSTVVIVAHPDLDESRVNATWVQALRKDDLVDLRILSESRGDRGFDAAAEQKVLADHARIVLQFPFRWYNAPPLLAEWLEIVLERGWAYGPGGHSLEGKELCIAVSTWSRADDYLPDGRYRTTMDELTSPFGATAARVGMRYGGGFFLHGVGDLSNAELDRAAQDYARWVNN